ncbi:hypothetical protein GGR42_002011 [Saonia flava]|uniref:Outer membrane protein beta-barrel domain-containing protein n=1 Tax=Saonia flava TaxID=523696 RepID=A0A846R409_9FLAO|nr:outer membrane beta-barrel protein [Saonia flava]NJB71549.1 hypothetical protein [Saonia flava]
MSKKNLDNLFQEKFKDFEKIPDEKVWRSIEVSLDNMKKDRKVIPIWWRLGGIAALLAILFYIINPFKDDNTTNPITTDIENTTIPVNKEKPNSNKDLIVPITENESAVVTNDDVNSSDKNSGSSDNNSINIPKKQTEKNSQPDLANSSREESDGMASQENTDSYNFSSVVDKEVVVNADNLADSSNEKRNTVNTVLIKDEENTVAQREEKKEDLLEKSSKKSLLDEIKENNAEEAIVENNSKRWSIGPSIAPVYYNSIGNGSPIDSDFASNSKSGDVNLSFGINVSYDISKKLSIRSGIHRADYGYNTNDIAFSSTLNGTADIDNINYSKSSRSIVVESSLKPKSFVDNETSASAPALNGNMLQQFGYLEMPLELNYALVDKKLGVNLIGGVSSMFLMDNNIVLESDGLSTEMGEANNINPINFSTNIGFGINYKITPKTQLNVEPMFKYHLNTFSEASGSFQPYSIGVYSGIKFKF